jgi:hypothetical protein
LRIFGIRLRGKPDVQVCRRICPRPDIGAVVGESAHEGAEEEGWIHSDQYPVFSFQLSAIITVVIVCVRVYLCT